MDMSKLKLQTTKTNVRPIVVLGILVSVQKCVTKTNFCSIYISLNRCLWLDFIEFTCGNTCTCLFLYLVGGDQYVYDINN